MNSWKYPSHPHPSNQLPIALIIGAVISGSLLSTALPVAAQSSSTMEEVVVTARKRGDESLQDIGGSIQALGGEDLASKAVMGFNDYMRQVPGLSSNNSGSGQTQISMRGVTSSRLNHANPNIPSTASVYFDETPVTTSGFNPDAGLVDIARIEVLRGPQGTLFGASSMSGAIRIIPNEPVLGEVSGSARFSYFSTTDGAPSQNTDVTLNLPIGDTFALRIAGYGINNGGYIDNVYSGPANSGGEDYNNESIVGARVSALWDIASVASIKLTHMTQELNADGRPDEYLQNDPLTGLGLNSRTSNNGNILFPEESIDITGERQVAKFVDETFDDEMNVTSLEFDASLEDYSITSVTSYMNREFENLLDDTYRSRDWVNLANFNWFDVDGDGSGSFVDGTGIEGLLYLGADPTDPNQAIPVIRSPFENNTQLDRIAQEIRIVSDYDGPFNFIAGLYYEDETRDFQQDIIIPGLDSWLDSYCDFCTTPAYGATRSDSFFEGRYSFDTTQKAFFSELSYSIWDLEFILGTRYYDYKQKADVFFGGFIEFSEDRLSDSIDEDGTNFKAEVVYNATEEVTLYTSYSEGFRLGSVQQFISSADACLRDLRNIGAIGMDEGADAIPTTIDSDELANYEFGIKATLFGNTTVNGSLYYIDWSDARSQVFLGCGWILEGNFIDIESKGLELNVNSQITDNFALTFNLGTIDSEVARVDASATSIASEGDRTPMTPELTYSLGFDFTAPAIIDNQWDLFVRADISYTDDMVSSLGTSAEQANQGLVSNLTIPDNTVGNLYFGFGAENWELSLFVRNVTDERVVTGIDIDRRGPAAYSIARPRNIGATARIFF
ncbi:TonB-dependent receptor [Marinibactrum halimedae]|uniref:TonB-dependent receptor n=1 Tax=Marinibactrum halimedae TaxID=1444977 RepID=A0AA37T9C2_9GAMM|nr:TonB-dependent receptor [Marinibactrum halimedae]MCD9458159.1 TonB-dependent receptor [Marinibactrum halimedae]GLS25092.1 TonB-dependent receptor [Marinibactrum halimedae]